MKKINIITLLLLSAILMGCNDDGSSSGARPIDPIDNPIGNTTLPDGNTTMTDDNDTMADDNDTMAMLIDADGNGLLEIATLEDLYSIRDNLDGNYELVNNLDFNNASSYASGSINTDWTTRDGWPGIGSCTGANNCEGFSGEFEGNNFTISNLFINTDKHGAGLFAAANGTIQNIGVINARVFSSNNRAGGLIGNGNDANVENSYATGSVSGNLRVGGLIGSGSDALVENSYAKGSVNGTGNDVGGLVGAGGRASVTQSYATGTVSGSGVNVGGLIGSGNNANVDNSYATGSVSGTNNVGGLIGIGTLATVSNSYAIGSVSGTNNVGGLIGFGTLPTVVNSYWDTDTTGQTTSSGGGTGKTTSELQSPTSATGIYEDWTNCWDFGNTTQYPVLTCTPGGIAEQR